MVLPSSTQPHVSNDPNIKETKTTSNKSEIHLAKGEHRFKSWLKKGVVERPVNNLPSTEPNPDPAKEDVTDKSMRIKEEREAKDENDERERQMNKTDSKAQIAPMNVKKRSNWFRKSRSSTNVPSDSNTLPLSSTSNPTFEKEKDSIVERTTLQTVPRSRSWFSNTWNKSTTILTQVNSSSSEDSEPVELLSTESANNLSSIDTLIKRLEEDENIPIVIGNYFGEPIFKKNIFESTIFQAQLGKFYSFDKFDEAAYFSWNIWNIDECGKKKITRVIECKSDFVDFFRHFNYEKVFIMRTSLVPNYNLFHNGYLVKLKLLHGRTITNAELGLYLFMKCCKNSILNNVPHIALNINVCGYTYTRRKSMTLITLWIHPILSMSFDITNQVKLLIQLLNFGIKLNKITLVDINNNSKTLINPKVD